MITIELVDKAWANFDKFKETAEQHDFFSLFMLDVKLARMYNNLHVNWDENHALIFMQCMEKVAKQFGFECPHFERTTREEKSKTDSDSTAVD